MKRCAYCGVELKRGTTVCPGCHKKTGSASGKDEDKPGLTSRDAYEKTMVPWWLAFLIVGVFLLGLVLLFTK